jgi:hypothetical protein
MPSKSADVEDEKQYEKLKETGMSKSRAAHIANSPGASRQAGTGSSEDRRRATRVAHARRCH